MGSPVKNKYSARHSCILFKYTSDPSIQPPFLFLQPIFCGTRHFRKKQDHFEMRVEGFGNETAYSSLGLYLAIYKKRDSDRIGKDNKLE